MKNGRTLANGYEATGKTTADGLSPIYTKDGGRAAYIIVNGLPRIARFCGMVAGVGIAARLDLAQLTD